MSMDTDMKPQTVLHTLIYLQIVHVYVYSHYRDCEANHSFYITAYVCGLSCNKQDGWALAQQLAV